MRIFKIKPFDEWMEEVGITDSCLIKAVLELDNGLYGQTWVAIFIKKECLLITKGKAVAQGLSSHLRLMINLFFFTGMPRTKKAILRIKKKRH